MILFPTREVCLVVFAQNVSVSGRMLAPVCTVMGVMSVVMSVVMSTVMSAMLAEIAARNVAPASLARAACLAISAQAAGARTGIVPSASGMMTTLVVLVAALVVLVFEQVLE